MRIIGEIHDGRTRELLLRAGLVPAHRFVEFGWGLGYVSRWAAGFEFVHVDAQHPHYMTGEHKGFWNWTLRAAAQGLVNEGTLSASRLEEFVAGMNEADVSPHTLVAHCRMHQLIAKKPAART